MIAALESPSIELGVKAERGTTLWSEGRDLATTHGARTPGASSILQRSGHPRSAFTPRVRWMALVERLRRPPRDVKGSRTRRFAAITASLMGASDEGIGCERPCPGGCRIGEVKEIRAPCVRERENCLGLQGCAARLRGGQRVIAEALPEGRLHELAGGGVGELVDENDVVGDPPLRDLAFVELEQL